MELQANQEKIHSSTSASDCEEEADSASNFKNEEDAVQPDGARASNGPTSISHQFISLKSIFLKKGQRYIDRSAVLSYGVPRSYFDWVPLLIINKNIISENCKSYCEEHKFNEAYGLLEWKSRLSSQLRNADFLLDYAVTLLATDRVWEYNQLKERIKTLLQKELRTLSEDMFKLGIKFSESARYFHSLVILDVAVDMFFDKTDPYKSITYLEHCMQGMKKAITEGSAKQEDMQHFFTRSFLPRMRVLMDMAEGLQNLNEGYKIVKLAWITHCIEVCDSNDETRKVLLATTTKRMKDTLGSRAYEYQIYGTLMNNLGALLIKLGEKQEAVKCLTEALECFRSAKDFERPGKREKFIHDTSRALRMAMGQLNKDDKALLSRTKQKVMQQGTEGDCAVS